LGIEQDVAPDGPRGTRVYRAWVALPEDSIVLVYAYVQPEAGGDRLVIRYESVDPAGFQEAEAIFRTLRPVAATPDARPSPSAKTPPSSASPPMPR